MSDLQLKLNGEIHRGWTSIRVRRSLEQVASTFSLTLTSRWGEDEQQRNIKTGDQCDVWIDQEKLITGYVDNVSPAYDAKTHTLNVTGRSKTGDLVDCSVASKTFNNRNLVQIAQDLCSPFDIDVISNTDTGAEFKKQTLEDGQSIFEFIDMLARIRAVRVITDVDGNLVFTRTSKERLKTSLTLGGNILKASGTFSSQDLFSEYLVKAQKSGSDESWGESSASIERTITSEHVKRHRPTVLLVDGPGDSSDCQRRGEWQRNATYGRARGVVYTVNGWQHSAGLWQPNTLVPVNDTWLGVVEDRLIVTVDYILDGNGEFCELQVMPKEAFDLIPLPEPKEGDDAGWGS